MGLWRGERKKKREIEGQRKRGKRKKEKGEVEAASSEGQTERERGRKGGMRSPCMQEGGDWEWA